MYVFQVGAICMCEVVKEGRRGRKGHFYFIYSKCLFFPSKRPWHLIIGIKSLLFFNILKLLVFFFRMFSGVYAVMWFLFLVNGLLSLQGFIDLGIWFPFPSVVCLVPERLGEWVKRLSACCLRSPCQSPLQLFPCSDYS